MATLLNWTDAIEFQSETRPWLAIQKAWALALTGDLDRVEPTLQAPEKLLAPLNPRSRSERCWEPLPRPGPLCKLAREYASAAEYAQQALHLLPDCSSISQSIRSVATSILGDASWINGNLEEAIQAYTEAIRIGQEASNLHMVIIANSNLGRYFDGTGAAPPGSDMYTQSLQMAVRPDGQRSPLAGKLYAGMGRLSYEWDRLDDAEQNIRQCLDLCRQWGDIGQQAIAYAMLARLEQARGNPEKAQEAMREAEQLAAEHPLSPRRSIQVTTDLARVWLAQGNLEKPSQLIQKSG